MTLLEYIEDPQRMAALAARLTTSPQYLRQIATKFRGRTCGPRFALRIEEATGGEVTAQSLRPDLWGEKAA